MLDDAIAVIGPPAVGKTALTLLLGQLPGRQVFRLREYVPETILAATATSAEQLGWIDDLTVTMALRAYLDSVVTDCTVHTVLLDNFPGSAQQVRLFLSIIRKLAPTCAIHPVELVADPATLNRRTRERRVCHQCDATRFTTHACRPWRIRPIGSDVLAAITSFTPGAATLPGFSPRGWSGTGNPRTASGKHSQALEFLSCNWRAAARLNRLPMNSLPY